MLEALQKKQTEDSHREKVECDGKKAGLQQGAAEAVQLPQREADDLFLLGGNCAQDFD